MDKTRGIASPGRGANGRRRYPHLRRIHTPCGGMRVEWDRRYVIMGIEEKGLESGDEAGE